MKRKWMLKKDTNRDIKNERCLRIFMAEMENGADEDRLYYVMS